MVEIREESPDDHGRVFEVQAAAFERENEAAVVDALRAAARPFVSLVATIESEIVGHIFFSPVSFEIHPEAPPAAALAPVAVVPHLQKRGIGSALVRAGLERCREHGWVAVFLVGDPGYYSKFGFTLAAPLGFTYGNPLFDAVLQMVELRSGAVAGYRGRVCFDPAFAEAGTE